MPSNETFISKIPKDQTFVEGFAAVAAAIGSAPLTVNIELGGGGTKLIADKTFGEIKAAALAGKIVFFYTVIPNILSSISVMGCISFSGNNVDIFFTGGDGNVTNVSGTESEYPTINLS